MQKPFTFKAYDFTLAAGGSQAILAGGEYFRILSATGALDVTVEGKGTMPDLLAGQAIKGLPFSRLVLRDKSGAPNTGFILVASSEFVDNRMFGTFDLSAATLAALESIDLNPASLNTLSRPLVASTPWSSTATLGAGSVAIFSAAANTNGAIIHSAHSQDIAAGALMQSFVAKATAPGSVVDGEVIALSQYAPVTGNSVQNIAMSQPQRIASGLGLYFYSSGAGSAGYARACRYTLL